MWPYVAQVLICLYRLIVETAFHASGARSTDPFFSVNFAELLLGTIAATMSTTDASMAAAAAPTRGPPAPTGMTPLSKRSATLSTMMRPSGPEMNHTALNEFVYALHNKMEAVETWAATVNDAVADHADRLDILNVSCRSTFTSVRTETDSLRASLATAAATAERDTRVVMGIVEANDLALKQKIEALITMMSTEIELSLIHI